MKGLTEQAVERIIRSCNIDHEHKEIAGTLREECKELDPWLPIESAPKDRDILVYAPPYQDLEALQYVCKWHESAGFCIDELRTPTHHKELSPDPTYDNFADT